ncbi:hypothetical protein BC936DRAFT_144526 [Jimgerdemannia flammicorona]|uniref:Cryptic loci regulator 2 N-terminal domain-containing protein n=1 Tax=Jimgerdemannia flammicorona TaxID=994334 RepID=A0A433DCB6_9FUNG|nr:hypothetical protein BC936DRAFT_144526 [Jimgerdemannia flammicorona]
MEGTSTPNHTKSPQNLEAKQKSTAKAPPPAAKVFQPPTFSDGVEEHHPKFSITKLYRPDGQLNYFRAYDNDEPVRLMWLGKFGDELAKLEIDTAANENPNPNPNPNAEGSTPKKRTGPEKSSGQYILSDFPRGYKLFCHYFVPKAKKADGAADTPSKDSHPTLCPITNVPARRDTYLFGHPTGQRFRSPNEFLPHLVWLATVASRDPRDCTCKYCPSLVRIQDTLAGVVTPKSIKKQRVGAMSLDSTDAEIQIDGPSFRTGEIVWAFVEIPAFMNANGGEGSSTAPVPATTGNEGLLWPSIVLKHVPPETQQNKTPSVVPAELPTPCYQLRSLILDNEHMFTEEQLLPWLAYVPELPPVDEAPSAVLNSQQLPVNLAELSSEHIGHLFIQSVQLATQIVHTFTPIGQYAHKEDQHRLANISDPEERQRLQKLEPFPHYQGLYLGAEKVMIKDMIRLTSERKNDDAAGSVSSNTGDNENLEFLEIGSIYENMEMQKIQFTGTIFFRRRNLDADSGIDKDPYVWVPKNKKNAEYTVDLEDLAGRYYYSWPQLGVVMGSTERQPKRSEVLRTNDWKELDEDYDAWTKRTAKKIKKTSVKKLSASASIGSANASSPMVTSTKTPGTAKFAIRSAPLPTRRTPSSSGKRASTDEGGSRGKKTKMDHHNDPVVTEDELTTLRSLSNEPDNLRTIDRKGKRPIRGDENPFVTSPAENNWISRSAEKDAQRGANDGADFIMVEDDGPTGASSQQANGNKAYFTGFARPGGPRKRGRPRKIPPSQQPQQQQPPQQPPPQQPLPQQQPSQQQPPQQQHHHPIAPEPLQIVVSNLVEHASVEYARYLQLSNDHTTRGLPGPFRAPKGLGPSPPLNSIPVGPDSGENPMIWHGAFAWPVVNGVMLGLTGGEEVKEAVKAVECKVYSFPLLYGENNEVVASNREWYFPVPTLVVTGTSHVDATTELFRNHKNGLGNGQLVGFVPVATRPDDSANHDGFIRILNAMNRAQIAVMIQKNGLCMVLRPAGSLIIALSVFNPALANTNLFNPATNTLRIEPATNKPAATPPTTLSGSMVRWKAQSPAHDRAAADVDPMHRQGDQSEARYRSGGGGFDLGAGGSDPGIVWAVGRGGDGSEGNQPEDNGFRKGNVYGGEWAPRPGGGELDRRGEREGDDIVCTFAGVKIDNQGRFLKRICDVV